MNIKSPQSLVQEALKEVKTISPEDALEKSKNNQCNLIDIRDATELENTGRVENALHISRGLLEFSVHPDSPYVTQNILNLERRLSKITSFIFIFFLNKSKYGFVVNK